MNFNNNRINEYLIGIKDLKSTNRSDKSVIRNGYTILMKLESDQSRWKCST